MLCPFGPSCSLVFKLASFKKTLRHGKMPFCLMYFNYIVEDAKHHMINQPSLATMSVRVPS
jgi:hypothetical protein